MIKKTGKMLLHFHLPHSLKHFCVDFQHNNTDVDFIFVKGIVVTTIEASSEHKYQYYYTDF